MKSKYPALEPMIPVHGVVRGKDIGYVACRDLQSEKELGKEPPDEISYFLLRWDGAPESSKSPKWGPWFLAASGQKEDMRFVQGWFPVFMGIAKSPKEQCVAFSKSGSVYSMGSGICEEELVTEDPIVLAGGGVIDGKIYAVGSDRKIFCRENIDNWNEELTNLSDFPGTPILQGIVGQNHNHMIAYGWEGTLFNKQGDLWQSLPQVIDHILTGGVYLPSGEAYFIGRRGTVIKVEGEKVRLLHGDQRKEFKPEKNNEETGILEDLWTITEFKGKIYISSMYHIFVLENDQLKPVNYYGTQPLAPYYLSSCEDVMWNVGTTGEIVSFDGETWSLVD